MSQPSYGLLAKNGEEVTSTMRALVFHEPNQISVEEVPLPRARAAEAIMRITLSTICGTDLHILKGEYPVRPD
jgi:threonine dehydrogenase-like Zn-dependent dehydrogenase